MIHRLLLVFVLCQVVSLPVLRAQQADTAAREGPALAAGARLRVATQAHGAFTATLLQIRRDTLLLATERRERLRLPVDALQRMELSGGHARMTATGAGTGFLVAAALGGGLMAIVCAATYDCPGVVPLLYGGLAGVLGAGVGAVVGASTVRERWLPVSAEELRAAGEESRR